MRKSILLFSIFFYSLVSIAQTNPAIVSWLQNTNETKGRHYVNGNSTPIQDNDLANVQQVSYSNNWAYIKTNGIPSYVTGPFLDGNPSIATNQNAIFKVSLNPIQNPGTPVNTTGGNIGIFINGVALFDYRDGVSWRNATNSLAGGPLGGFGDGVWNRDAVVGELKGFDCSKGHPAMGNYHHHQNPSAFNLDLNVISTICNLYTSDGLYVIDSAHHSPLIGFAYDGFPIYGAYAYKNVDGTGGITRMKSSYVLRNITVRNTNANGATVTPGPAVNATYPLGYFREDYQYNATNTNTPDYLDEHNGRFCITPEYPNGIYCYFATVDNKWNSAYPYVVGPTFFGTRTTTKVNAITEPVQQYTQPLPVATVNAISCNAVLFSNQKAIVKTAYSSTASVPYTGGNGIQYANGSVINSTGVIGLTATLQAGTLANGNGNLIYNISGTPADTGMASFAINFGGKSCTINLKIIEKASCDFCVVPNPIQNNILKLNMATDNKINGFWIYDVVGKLVYQAVQPDVKKGIDISRLPKGSYIIKIKEEKSNQVFTMEFVK